MAYVNRLYYELIKIKIGNTLLLTMKISYTDFQQYPRSGLWDKKKTAFATLRNQALLWINKRANRNCSTNFNENLSHRI